MAARMAELPSDEELVIGNFKTDKAFALCGQGGVDEFRHLRLDTYNSGGNRGLGILKTP
jgi:hypothetical protein